MTLRQGGVGPWAAHRLQAPEDRAAVKRVGAAYPNTKGVLVPRPRPQGQAWQAPGSRLAAPGQGSALQGV